MKKILFVVSTLLISVMSIFADDEKVPQLNPYIPKSPQAEAFQRIGEFQVNNSFGIPDISIPLFTLDYHGYKVPLCLRYEAKPLRPGYNYDVFGNGWAMTGVSSCVSRTILDLPDEECDFRLVDDKIKSEKYVKMGKYLHQYNWRYDKFNCVLPDGSSFEFIIYRDKYTDKIKYSVSDARNVEIRFNISYLTVVDENGVKYTFGEAEKAFERAGRASQGMYVSWLLTKIELPNVKDPINYIYNGPVIQTDLLPIFQEPVITYKFRFFMETVKDDDQDGKDYSGFDSEKRKNEVFLHSTNDVHNEYSEDLCFYKMKLLKSIECGKSLRIDFNYDYNSGEHLYVHLQNMKVKDGAVSRDYRFVSKSHLLEDYGSIKEQVNSLEKLIISGQTEAKTDSLGYKFVYTTFDPGHFTDHWGNLTYYGGSNMAKYNVANFNVYLFDWNGNSNDGIHNPESYYGGDSLTDLEKELKKNPCMTFLKRHNDAWYPYSKVCLYNKRLVRTPSDIRRPASPLYEGVLQSIIYPAGGKIVFNFENNKFITATNNNGDYEPIKKDVAL